MGPQTEIDLSRNISFVHNPVDQVFDMSGRTDIHEVNSRLGKWVQYVVTLDSSTFSAYIDGKRVVHESHSKPLLPADTIRAVHMLGRGNGRFFYLGTQENW
jgi:hypothetical protein